MDREDSTFTAVNPGMTKITVKIKVVLQEKDPNDSDSKEKSYTMKRKFQLEVLPRDKEPEGMNVGEYVLAKTKNELEYNYDIFKRQNSSLRMIIVGTRTKDSDEGTETTHYTQGIDNSMMGGGKSGKKVADGKIAPNANNKDCIKYNDLPKNTQEIILEQADNYDSDNNPYWYLNVGKNENGEKLYLYASNKAKNETTEETNENTGQGNTGGFNMDEMMEMFNPSAGLKVGTKAEAVGEVDSCKVSITFNNDIATIKFCEVPDDLQNTIVLTSSFDMESMMGMFEGMGGNKEEGEDPEEPAEEEEESTFDIGSFDMFMASFNTKKPEDIDNEKAMLPRIFVFKQYDEYPVEIGDAEWKTIVSDYDAEPIDGDLDVYVVTSVERGDGQSKAMLQKVDMPGLWFLKSNRPLSDISDLIYELSVKGCAHFFVRSQFKREIQKDVLAKVMKDYLEDKVAEAAASEDERGLHDEAQRMTQSFAKAMELLDQIDGIMGDSPMDFAEFTDIYIAGLSDVEVGVIPPSVDGLSMGTMIRTRPRQMRAAVILGACEGVLPLSPQTEGLFSVDEKEYFKTKGFALGSLDDIKMDEENAAMYRMMARPSEKVYISWAGYQSVSCDRLAEDAVPADRGRRPDP